MKSYPTPEQVMSDLGDKVTDALSRAVHLARGDLLEYRNLRPAWVAVHSERGLANWIHDRQWFHLISALTGVPGVNIRDTEPVREVAIGLNYLIRVKRHHWDGAVSTYPTQGALEFMVQPPTQEALEGLHETRLLTGYSWDKEVRDIAMPVLSLRDGVNKPVWIIELPRPSDDGTAPTAFPASPAPKRPTIDTSRLPVEKGDEEHPK